MKGCNCSGGCKHRSFDIGYKFYCNKYPERHKKFSEENSSRPIDWVLENVNMDCYEPNEVTQLLDDVKTLMNELKENLK